MKRRLVILAAALSLSSRAEAQMVVGTFTGSVNYSQTINGYVAYIDISSGVVQPVVTAPLAAGTGCAQFGYPVVLTDTVTFATASAGVVLAVNANLGPAQQTYTSSFCGTPYGLLKSNGAYLNPIEIAMGKTGPSLLFFSDSQATIATPSQSDGLRAQWAVSGWTGSNGGGTALLVAGVNNGSSAQPVPSEIAPRVGVGLTRDKQTLILAMVNGVEAADIGLRLYDVADLLKGLGAWDAINLDGGGSSTFLYLPTGSIVQTPSLVALFKSAGPVPNNPNQLAWTLTMVPASQTCISYPNGNVTNPNQLCLAAPGSGYRPVYANLGFAIVR